MDVLILLTKIVYANMFWEKLYTKFVCYNLILMNSIYHLPYIFLLSIFITCRLSFLHSPSLFSLKRALSSIPLVFLLFANCFFRSLDSRESENRIDRMSDPISGLSTRISYFHRSVILFWYTYLSLSLLVSILNPLPFFPIA